MRMMPVRLACVFALLTACLSPSSRLMVAKAEPGVSAPITLSFSGHVWKVKSSEKRVGPGPNYFSDSKENVWVDDEGRLHLKITNREGGWHCAEVISEESFGLGTYRFHVLTPLSRLDPNITLGLFTWSDAPAYAHREIDIECTKWGKAGDTNNAQFVVQPYQPRGRLLRYRVPEELEAVTYSFLWQSNSVLFKCVAAQSASQQTSNSLIREWNFAKGSIPLPGGENARINLWLCTSRGPLESNKTEVVISKFEFLPLKAKP